MAFDEREPFQGIIQEVVRDFDAPEDAKRIHQAAGAECLVGMPGVRKAHIVKLQGVLADLQETGRDVQAPGVGAALDPAHVHNERITGNLFPFGAECLLVDEVIQHNQGVDVRVPVALVLFCELIGRDAAGDLGPLSVGTTLEGIPAALIQAPVSSSKVVEAFAKVRTVLDGESDHSGDSGAVLVNDLLNLREILGHELARAAHGAERAKEVLLASVSLDEAQLVNGEIFVEDQVRGALVEVGVNLLDVGAVLRIA